MSLGNNIRNIRRERGLSQECVANKLGYKSYTTIQKWESGVSEPPFKVLKDLSELFNVDIDYFTKPYAELSSERMASYFTFIKNDTDFQNILEIYRKLSNENRKALIVYAEFLQNKKDS